jgi:large-conductance mechanosensitive channel
MKNSILTIILFITYNLLFAGNSNAIAYQIGEFIGMLIPIGLVILIIWLIVRAVNKKKKTKE